MAERFRSILLFGPPGSGKGTQGKLLARGGGHVHLSSGDIFRGLSHESPRREALPQICEPWPSGA